MKNCAALAVMHLSLMRIGLRFMPESSFRRTSITTQACNIPSQEVIFSDVFLMLCQIGGGVPCSKEENSKRNKHVRQLDAIKDAEIIGKILQCKLGIELVRKEIIYVKKEDIQMPGMWVRDRNI